MTHDLAGIIGDPGKVDEELQRFRETTQLLSANRPRMIEQYPKQWVALYDREVRAAASTLNALLARVDELGLPREHIIVRFVDKELRTMIL